MDSGSLKLRTPPSAMMAAVMRIGIALLTPMSCPNATLPRIAAMRPMKERKPNPDDLPGNKGDLSSRHSEWVRFMCVVHL